MSEGNGEGGASASTTRATSTGIIEVTSFAEFVLRGRTPTTVAHPLFSKMFVETEIGRGGNAIFARRRPRAAERSGNRGRAFRRPMPPASPREHRGRDRPARLHRPRALASPIRRPSITVRTLGGSAGFVLDPVMALRRRVRVPANKKVQLTFWTVVGANRGEIEAVVALLDHPESFARQAMLSWTRSQVQTRHMGLEPRRCRQRAAAGALPDLSRISSVRTAPETIASGLGKQSALWPMAISAIIPIFTVRIGDVGRPRDRRAGAALSGIPCGRGAWSPIW